MHHDDRPKPDFGCLGRTPPPPPSRANWCQRSVSRLQLSRRTATQLLSAPCYLRMKASAPSSNHRNHLPALGAGHPSNYLVRSYTRYRTSTPRISFNTSYQKLPFGSGDYPDKLQVPPVYIPWYRYLPCTYVLVGCLGGFCVI